MHSYMDADVLLDIVYIDEIEDERENFFTDAYQSHRFGQIYIVHPEEKLEDMISILVDMKVDAVITDFNLSENCPISYNGEELITAFLNVRSDFPCFIRTAVDSWMQDISEDVNRVYSKNGKSDSDIGRFLYDRVIRQVQLYRNKIDNWKEEFSELLKVAAEDRNASQVERLLELDSKIESSLGKDVAIPPHLKDELLEKEHRLIDETELLVKDIKQQLGLDTNASIRPK